jgi:gas vesicle protein
MSNDREVTVIEAESGSGFKWFLLGAAVGAGLGLLFAPQSGERTRRDITRKARHLKRQAGEKLEDFAEEVQDRGKRIKESAEDFIEEVEDRGRRVKATAVDFVDDLTDEVRDTRRRVEHNASSARDELERRLAEARARRRAAIAADGTADDDADDDTE